MNTKDKNKRFIIVALISVFVLPVVLAKLALDNDWFNRGSTNKGELLQPVMDLSVMLRKETPKWRLVYQIPTRCDAACENAIYSIQQVWLALGRETDRAQPTVLYNKQSDPTVLAQLKQEQQVKLVAVEDASRLTTDAVYLVDTLNNAMLRYGISTDRQEAIMESRNILADVRKLMKLSRIG